MVASFARQRNDRPYRSRVPRPAEPATRIRGGFPAQIPVRGRAPALSFGQDVPQRPRIARHTHERTAHRTAGGSRCSSAFPGVHATAGTRADGALSRRGRDRERVDERGRRAHRGGAAGPRGAGDDPDARGRHRALAFLGQGRASRAGAHRQPPLTRPGDPEPDRIERRALPGAVDPRGPRRGLAQRPGRDRPGDQGGDGGLRRFDPRDRRLPHPPWGRGRPEPAGAGRAPHRRHLHRTSTSATAPSPRRS